MKNLFALVFIFASIGLAGCGDDDGPVGNDNSGTAVVNEQAAGVLASTALSATQLSTGDDGQAAAFSLMAVGIGAISLITPDGQPVPVVPLEDIQWDLAPQQLRGEGCECAANSCVFVGCGDGLGFSITGTISWTTGSLDADYTVSGALEGQEYSFTVFADVDYTPTSINGTISTSGQFAVTTESGLVVSAWDTSVTFNSVTYNTAGQPTGGSISVVASITVNGQSYNGSGTVAFS